MVVNGHSIVSWLTNSVFLSASVSNNLKEDANADWLTTFLKVGSYLPVAYSSFGT